MYIRTNNLKLGEKIMCN